LPKPHGRPAAVVLSVDDVDSLDETLDVMGSTQLLGDIREALSEMRATSTCGVRVTRCA
jgi:antitoxin YefM